MTLGIRGDEREHGDCEVVLEVELQAVPLQHATPVSTVIFLNAQMGAFRGKVPGAGDTTFHF